MKMTLLFGPDEGDAGNAGGVTAPPEETKFNNFKDDLPDRQKSFSTIKDIDTIEKLVDSHDHAQRMIGTSRMEIPGEGASPEDWNSYYKSGGRPDGDKGSGYILFEGETPKLPEGVTRDEEMESWFKEISFNRGLSQNQARGMYEDFMEFQGSSSKKSSETNEKTLQDWDENIKKEFGSAYDQNIDIARQFVKNNGTPEFIEMLNSTGLTNHPEMIKFCYNVGKHTVEHSGLNGGKPGGSNFILTPEQAKGEITRLESDPQFMKNYMSSSNPILHKEATEKMQKLFSEAYPTAEE